MKLKSNTCYILSLFVLLLSSCKEKQSDSTTNQPKIDVKSIDEALISNSYSQITMDCQGKQFAPTNCGNKEKGLYYEFKLADGKSIIEFKYKNKNFIHSFNESIFELGVNSYLFDNGSKMILVLDSFLEYGHTFYVYQIDEDSVKYIGSKNFDVKLDKNEIELKYNFNISEKDKILILKLGTGYDDINLYISNSFVLPLKENNLSNIKSKNNLGGLWQLDCNLQNSGIDIYVKESNMYATVAVAPPAIFVEAKVIPGESENIYYLRFEEQDMNPPAASENELDPTYTSKTENIAKIELKDNKLNFWWYGFYNTKTKKWSNKESQFSNNGISNLVILNRCE
ncbi:hypothetical protein [Flavobacterium sp.]|uniref:hypothetical protein n=1 Tax=Flavobacterium sp. TaxID=239 RepID=UPI00286D87C4|nr:hypothetical protein [Flavobacterium sp.]